jgi:hypothetical protein
VAGRPSIHPRDTKLCGKENPEPPQGVPRGNFFVPGGIGGLATGPVYASPFRGDRFLQPVGVVPNAPISALRSPPLGALSLRHCPPTAYRLSGVYVPRYLDKLLGNPAIDLPAPGYGGRIALL